VACTAFIGLSVPARGGADANQPEEEPFPKGIVGNAEYIEIGKDVFAKQCRFCHGKGVYPGKAPQLDPSRYTPEFIFDRDTNGYKSMPPWSAVFSTKERQGVVAYILSREFDSHP
jgi:mono/diheme cytochrome c family protein